MKKFMICMFAMATLAMAGCNKDKENGEDNNPANAFVGRYEVEVNAQLYTTLGSYPLDMPVMVATIEKNGDQGDVTITMMNRSINGYVKQDGLHLDPFIVNREIMGATVAVTVAVPVVKAPESGLMNTTATLTASIAGFSANGTADVFATRIE